MNTVKITDEMSEREVDDVVGKALNTLDDSGVLVFEIVSHINEDIKDPDCECANDTLVNLADIETENKEYFEHNELSFGKAIEFMNRGNMVARSGWNGTGLFVFKQIPAVIPIKIVPGMQSLPPDVKSEFIAREARAIRDKNSGTPSNLESGRIKYSNQLALVDQDNNITGWNPSTSDALAHDWYVVRPS